MNQRELRDAVKERLNAKLIIAQYDLDIIMETMIETIQDTVASGEKVTLRNFGTFQPKTKKAVTKKMPRQGDVQVPERTVPQFKPGKGFIERLMK